MSIVNSVMSLGDNVSLNRKVQFIGYVDFNVGNGGDIILPLTAIGVKSGDLIVLQRCCGSASNDTSAMTTPTGFTEVTSTYSNDTSDTTQEIYYKISNGTEDEVTFSDLADTQASTSCSAMVFRNTNGSAPSVNIDSSSTNVANVTWSEVSGLASDSVILFFAATGHTDNFIEYTDPGDLDFFHSDSQGDTQDHTYGLGFKYAGGASAFTASAWNVAATASTSSVARAAVIIQ